MTITAMAVALGAAVIATAPSIALAQEGIKAVDPYVVVVTTDKAPMRCSNGVQLFYPVRELKSGELLRVNGEGPGWLRVEYTPGMQAYVPASDVEADRDGKTVKLNKPSRLLAVSAEGKRPWWPLELDADIPAGTVLHVAKPYATPDGVVEGYYVDAPAKARGFVKPEHIRKASAEEAGKYVGTGAPAKTPETKPTDAGKPPPATTKPEAPAVAPAPTANNPTPAGTPSGFNPVTPAPEKPATATPTGGTSPEQPVVTPAPVPAPPPPPPPKKDEEIEQIRAMFDKVMSTGGDAEVPAVITLFEQKLAKLGSAPIDETIKTALRQRLEALKLRQDILQQRDAVRQFSVQQQSQMKQILLVVEQAQKQAIYNIVGRIQPSTVYDGKRGLPLMYRVESADALSPRTVGYIIPTDGIDLLPKIGKVCGVVGESRMDSSLQLNIIAPRRIDVLDVGGTVTSPAGTFPGGGTAPTNPPAPEVQPPAAPATPPATAPEPEK
jgi:hypothetical protein